MNGLRNIAIAIVIAASAATTVIAHADETQETISLAAPVPGPSVKAGHGHVEITIYGDDCRQITIYALTGQVVRSFTAAPGISAIELPAGYYIVKIDRMSQKVIVK